jgi:hypothetical protein
MAKKSTKSSRRARAKKEQTSKKNTTATNKTPVTPEELVIIAEGSNEPVAKVKKPATKKATPKKSTKASETVEKSQAVEAEAEKTAAIESIEQDMQPSRRRMLVSAFALAVIVIALVFGAAIMRQQSAQQSGAEGTKAGQSSTAADDILQSGGKMCTNEQATSDVNGSTNPQAVGMILQTNPSNNIQTPQTYGSGGSDAAALQGASCF